MMTTASKSIPRFPTCIPVIGIKFPIKLEASLLPDKSRVIKLINKHVPVLGISGLKP